MILAWLSLAFIAGLVAGGLQAVPVPACLAAAALLCLAALAIRRRFLTPLLVIAAFVMGVARTPHSGPSGPNDLAYYAGRTLQLHGTVSAEPDIRDTGSNYRVDIHSLILRGVTKRVHGALAIHTSRAVQLDYGDSVQITGHLLKARAADGRGINAEVRFPRVLDDGPADTGFLGSLNRFRQWLEAGINQWLPEPEAALLIAITLGAKSASLGGLAPILIHTGLIHLVAISGIKVAMVAGTIHQIARRLGSRNLTLGVSLLSLLTYVLLTGATPAGLRSAGMWIMVFVAAYIGRQTLSVVSLSFVLALMLAHDPSLLYDLGFQMSALGTAGIVMLSPPVVQRLRLLPSPFVEAFATSIAAQLYTLPIVINGFPTQSTTGPLSNMLILPALPLAIALGFALGCLAGVGPIAAPLGAVSYALLHLIVQGAGFLNVLYFPVHHLSWYEVVPYYSVLGSLGIRTLRRAGWAPIGARPHLGRELAVALAATCAFLSWSSVWARASDSVGIYWLGSGHAVLVQSPDNNLLIDGSARPQELLERLASQLQGSGQGLDAVIVTDPRASNTTGLTDVLKHYRVSEVLDVGAEYPSSSYARWRAALRTRNIPVYGLRTGATVDVGAAHIVALGPDGLCPLPQNCAGLLKITLSGRSVLLAGSASSREQHEAVFRGVSLPSSRLAFSGTVLDPAFSFAVMGSRVRVPSLPSDQVIRIDP